MTYLRGIFVYILSVLITDYDNRIKAIFETQKSTLVHGFTHRDYTPGEGNNFNYTSVKKKIVIKETASNTSDL